MIPLKPIYDALGKERAAVLPGFHAMSGADNTGSFYGNGKPICWKAFYQSTKDVIAAFAELGTASNVSIATLSGIEKFVCNLYMPNARFSQVKDVRWWLFENKQVQSESLPSTHTALFEGINRAHFQALVFEFNTILNPLLPSPQGYGWELKDNEWSPVMSQLLPASKAILQLVKRACAKTRCSTNRCQCRKAGLVCTDLCQCPETDDPCDNSITADGEDDNDDDSPTLKMKTLFTLFEHYS